jgi:Ca2+-binding RTX toxin-like protein
VSLPTSKSVMTLEGGLGVDKLSGGTGNDQFRYERGETFSPSRPA